MRGIPGGTESETNSSAIDSGDDWNKTEGVRALSRCSTPTGKIGPTWAEVHAAAQEEKMARNQDMTWEEIVSKQWPGEVGNWDAENWDAEDGQSTDDPQFEDAHVEEEEYEDDVVIESVTEEELEEPVAGKPPTQENLMKSSQEM